MNCAVSLKSRPILFFQLVSLRPPRLRTLAKPGMAPAAAWWDQSWTWSLSSGASPLRTAPASGSTTVLQQLDAWSNREGPQVPKSRSNSGAEMGWKPWRPSSPRWHTHPRMNSGWARCPRSTESCWRAGAAALLAPFPALSVTVLAARLAV